MSFVFILFVIALAPLAWAAWRRPSGGRPVWILAMVGSELAPWFLGVLVMSAAGFIVAGWVGGTVGRLGLVAAAPEAIAFVIAITRSRGVTEAAASSVSNFLGTPVSLPAVRLRSLVPPRSSGAGLHVDPSLTYGPHPRHLVDRIRSVDLRQPAPAIIHLHGGGWWRGSRHRQGLPLLHHLARNGWVAFTPSYRLSPEATFPDHLVDVKRLVVWIRANALELGVDPSFIAIAGGSAGGQLAALAALTGRERSLQPGFEEGDASVQACIPFYGVHDLVDEAGGPLWPYLVDQVMKSEPSVAPVAWHQASPTRMATADRPPFFVVHGSADTLVDPGMSRDLVAALRAVGGPGVGHLEVPWANHGFDYFRSLRSLPVVHGVTAALVAMRDWTRVEGGLD